MGMDYEVLEAIEVYFEDDIETMVDCYVWLNKLGCKGASDRLLALNRCPKCGSELSYHKTPVSYYETIDPSDLAKKISTVYWTNKYCPYCRESEE